MVDWGGSCFHSADPVDCSSFVRGDLKSRNTTGVLEGVCVDIYQHKPSRCILKCG